MICWSWLALPAVTGRTWGFFLTMLWDTKRWVQPYYIFKTGWRLWPPTRVIHINLRQKVHSNEVASGLEVWVFL